MLIDEIIDLATDDKSSVSVLLRKCLILGHKLKNEQLTKWAQHELNGYAGEDTLPEYRVTTSILKGKLSGPFGSGVDNFPVPLSLLDSKHQEMAGSVRMREPLSSYEELMRSGEKTFRLEWSADFAMYYQNRIVTENGCHVVQLWQVVGSSSFAYLFDAIRNRTLALALEIKASLGDQRTPLENLSPQQSANVDRSVTNNIFGGVNVLASGSAKVTSAVKNSQQPSIQSLHDLTHVLAQLGLSEESLRDLPKMIEEDHGKLGDRVTSWIKKSSSTLLIAGAKVGGSVAQSVLTELIKQHLH